MKNLNKKGITLIALVVTIIVLLILAGVSIATLTGENGILNKANEAKIMTELGKVNEAIEIYKIKEMAENSDKEFTDNDLAKNTNLAKKVVANDTSRNLLILKDLKEIDTSSPIGKGYKKMNLDTTDSINTVLNLNDIYVKDLTDGTLYYIINGEIYSIGGTTQIAELPFEKVEGKTGEWEAIDNGDNTVSLVQYKGNSTEVVIPNFYEGKIVKEIKAKNEYTMEELVLDPTKYSPVFMPNTSVTVEIEGNTIEVPLNTTVTKITISEGIRNIGNSTFLGCVGWKGNLTIPDSMTSIGEGAFVYCSGLNGKISIGKNVETIGKDAFYSCNGLTGDLVIPDSVTSIGSWAFENCSGLNGKISIGKNVKTIGEGAFISCKRLIGELVIPDSVTSIGKIAFQNCSGLTGTVYSRDNLIVGTDAFSGTGISYITK